jgi:hypothetical protein
MAIEKGTHVLYDGTRIYAGTTQISPSLDWIEVQY